MSRAERLNAFVEAYQGKEIQWGADDCSMWPALWVQQETGLTLDLPKVEGMRACRQYLKDSGGIAYVWGQHSQ